jgi:hypothetical protein
MGGMMTIEYRRRVPRTLGHLMWQSMVSALILQPLLLWQFVTGRVVVSVALAGLVLVALTLFYRGWSFLVKQELQHPQPTPEMTFVFTLVPL